MAEQYITESVVRKRFITISVDNKDMLREANAYNERMNLNRAKMNDIREIKKGYLIGSLILGLCILVISDALNNRHPLYFILLGLVLVCLTLWTVTRSNVFLIMHLAASIGLIFWDKAFAYSLALKLLLGMFYLWKDIPLHRELGYPFFNNLSIEIEYKDGHKKMLV